MKKGLRVEHRQSESVPGGRSCLSALGNQFRILDSFFFLSFSFSHPQPIHPWSSASKQPEQCCFPTFAVDSVDIPPVHGTEIVGSPSGSSITLSLLDGRLQESEPIYPCLPCDQERFGHLTEQMPYKCRFQGLKVGTQCWGKGCAARTSLYA